METGVLKEISSRPLSTIAPRRVNTSVTTTSSATTRDNQQENEQQLRQEEQRIIQQLQARDREVRAHEAAHIAAGRPYIQSGPSYTYQRGPDGRSYAIGGQVSLDTSEVRGDPQATLSKAEQVRRAALAPAQPSPQDLRVAANASEMAAKARLDLAIQQREELQAQIEEESNERRQDTESEMDGTEFSGRIPETYSVPVAESPPSMISQFV
ncbi:MAG: hypothetical protein EP315_02575 [Gammaproteobacteria bacterium]|nr:MAG: hypothetical protein EP315_02575 [Gammaproteobacteria bacterium]